MKAAAEFKDMETGAHISRMSLYAQKLAQAMGMPVDFVETITFASPMHDVGKIGIADYIVSERKRTPKSPLFRGETQKIEILYIRLTGKQA